jgi:hypothetical protein
MKLKKSHLIAPKFGSLAPTGGFSGGSQVFEDLTRNDSMPF